MRDGLGWLVLAGVFVVEVAAMVALGVWGWDHDPRVVLVWLLPLLGAVVWGLFASPRARLGGPLVRTTTKVLVFGLAVLALDTAGHPVAATVLLAAVVVVHALAALPSVRRLAPPTDRP